MIITKLLKKVAKNFTGGNIRPMLNGIEFIGNKAVATDSYKLIEIEYKEEIGNFNIGSKTILENSLDLEIIPKRENIHFPKYESFFLEDYEMVIGIDPKMLIQACECFVAEDIRQMRIKIKKPLSPFQLEGENDNVKIKSIIMPLKI